MSRLGCKRSWQNVLCVGEKPRVVVIELGALNTSAAARQRQVEIDNEGDDDRDFHNAIAAFGQAHNHHNHHHLHFHQLMNAEMNIHAAQQAMPGAMDYQHEAFANRRPEHVPPKPAKEGFTRSLTDDDVIICPSCEGELVHDKSEEQPIVKKGNKEPTKKEREEHPFWLVMNCGHVGSDTFLF